MGTWRSLPHDDIAHPLARKRGLGQSPRLNLQQVLPAVIPGIYQIPHLLEEKNRKAVAERASEGAAPADAPLALKRFYRKPS
eukprot:3289031-Pyramimonas_sp.AAC.1